MLVPVPYQTPEKKAKGARGGLHRKGTSDVTSKDAEAHSSAAEDGKEEEEEKEESHSPPARGIKKRMDSTRLEDEASKKGKASLLDDSTAATDNSSEWSPRVKPLAKS